MNDVFVQCPFDKKHFVPRSRIQIHIAKCQLKHPGMLSCPFNATHRLKPEDLDAHIKQCPAKVNVFRNAQTLPKTQDLMEKRPEVCLQKIDDDQEMWDD